MMNILPRSAGVGAAAASPPLLLLVLLLVLLVLLLLWPGAVRLPLLSDRLLLCCCLRVALPCCCSYTGAVLQHRQQLHRQAELLLAFTRLTTHGLLVFVKPAANTAAALLNRNRHVGDF